MRKTSKTEQATSIARVEQYHNGIHDESYAYTGFKSKKLFTSDRFIKLNNDYTRPDNKPLKAYGIEIECESVGISNQLVLAEIFDKIIFSHFPDDLFKMQRDGSLGGDSSVECITQVMTKEFIRNNYNAFKLMYNTYFQAFGISASRSGHCGMHVNISCGNFGKDASVQEQAIKKLYYIVNNYYDLCCDLFYRNKNNTYYCSRMRADKNYVKNMDLSCQSCSHGISFNLGHYNSGRIEIRLVGGQKDFACFRNTMESVFFLVDRVKFISWDDLNDITKIFKGCNNYVFDRLKSYCKDGGTISTAQLEMIRPTVEQVQYL